MDEGVVGVLPVLRVREFDASTAHAAWVEAGEPEPTDEEIEHYEAVQNAAEPIWAGVRPPAKPLQIAAGKPRYYKK